MRKNSLILTVLCVVFTANCVLSAENKTFEYPYKLVDACDPDGNGFYGLDPNGDNIEQAELQWLVGPPPTPLIAISLPQEHWVEVKFRGRIFDGPGDDIEITEWGAVGEQADIFITDGAGQEQFIETVTIPDTGGQILTHLGLDISGLSLDFVPRAIRIFGLDLEGESPGFDVHTVQARVYLDYCELCDLSGDGIVNFEDFSIMAYCWMSNDSNSCQAAVYGDLTWDDRINGSDLGFMAGQWLFSCDSNDNGSADPVMNQDVSSFCSIVMPCPQSEDFSLSVIDGDIIFSHTIVTCMWYGSTVDLSMQWDGNNQITIYENRSGGSADPSWCQYSLTATLVDFPRGRNYDVEVIDIDGTSLGTETVTLSY